MTTQDKPNFRYPTCARIQGMQDVLMISSFGLWAAVLGLSPVLAYHMLLVA
jgi:hypothetical protein